MFDRGKISFILFSLVILFFTVGGYFLMEYALDYEYEEKEEEIITEISDYRLDKTKDYVYFTNIEYPITGSLISTQDIVINLSGFEYLSEILNDSEDEYADLVTYESSYEFSSEDVLFSNEEGIYSITYREYTVVEYDKYISIIISDYEYDIVNLTNLISIEVYVIDKTNKVLLNEDEILDMYETNVEDIKTNVKEVLDAKVYSGEEINVDDTIDNFEYILYPNKVGSLEVLYTVLSTNNNYYDKLVIN